MIRINMKIFWMIFAFLTICIFLTPFEDAHARKGKKNLLKNMNSETRAEQLDRGLLKTGLVPIYPENVNILKVVSFFGDQTRYDGSSRTLASNHGYHNGMDITVDIGTPVLAVASGKVIQVAQGGQLVGNKIMIQHSPEDTGLDAWVYTKYQHFDELPTLAIGERVEMGQVIGKSGKTGTTGGHFGVFGYPHLHMNAYVSDSDKYMIKEGDHKVMVKDSLYIDPLALFYGKELNSHKIKDLSEAEKKFAVPFKTRDGGVVPQGTKFVWPFLVEKNKI